MDPAAFDESFTIIIAVAAAVSFWALWLSLTWQPSVSGRLKALRTRRMKTRGEQSDTANLSRHGRTSISFMRTVADRLNLLRGAAADQTRRRLRQAGFHSRDASVIYVFIKLALPLAFGFVMIGLTSVTDLIELPDNMVLPTCVGAVLAGFLMPELYIKNVITKRRATLNDVLPEGLDLLTICVEAGLSIDAAFRRVAREVAGSMAVLATEFEITAMELTYLSDRQQALENMTERTDSPTISALVNALRQTEKYGTPLANSLRVLAQEFRLTRMSKAEEKGARMPALMTVPLMVFILPTLITVLLAPAIMSGFALT